MPFRVSCLAAMVCLALTGGIIPSSVFAEKSVFAVPAISTSKNDGQDFGIIVPVLDSDEEGNLRSLLAPMLVHNSFLGVRGTVNYFRYWSGGRQLETVGSYTDQIERKLKFRYQDPGFIEGLFFVDIGAQFFKNATKRYFGLGQTTPEDHETNYTGREIEVHWNFGIHLNDVTRLSVNQRFRDVAIQRGGVEDEPFSKKRFPDDPGMDGASILAHRLDRTRGAIDRLAGEPVPNRDRRGESRHRDWGAGGVGPGPRSRLGNHPNGGRLPVDRRFGPCTRNDPQQRFRDQQLRPDFLVGYSDAADADRRALLD